MDRRDRDEDTGKYTEKYPLEEVLAALEEIGPAGTTDVAEKVGCDRRTAYLKLQELEERNEITSRKVGNALLWQIDK